MRIVEYSAKTAISRSGMAELDYAVNPYSGCSHGCVYCYAIDFTRIRDAATHWGNTIYVKTNLISLLANEIKRLKRGIVGVSTITDPYQPVEAKYRLSGMAIEMLLRAGFRVTVQTKSPLVRRDLNVLASHRSSCDVGFTITTLERKKALLLEPHSPSPESRLSAINDLTAAGVKTWIFLGPIIRGINDSSQDLGSIFRAASIAGTRIIYDTFVPYSGAMQIMRSIPGEFTRTKSYYADAKWREQLAETLEKLSQEYSVKCNSQQEEWLQEKSNDYSTLF